MRCSSFCTARSYDLKGLKAFLDQADFKTKTFDDVLSVAITHPSAYAFIFQYGCAIFWGLTKEDEQTFLAQLKAFEIDPLTVTVQDDFVYSIAEDYRIDPDHDEIILPEDDIMVKLSISYGLSQSAKLVSFEESVARTIETNKHLPEELASKGKLPRIKDGISRKIGELFLERASINLLVQILDVPEFFWKRPKYEPYYTTIAKYLDISSRVTILNHRLNVVQEIYQMLSDELKHRHTTRMEWAIVILIAIEIILVVLHDILNIT